MPESIGGDSGQYAQHIPEASHKVISKYKPYEEWHEFSIGFDAAIFKDQEFKQPAYEDA